MMVIGVILVLLQLAASQFCRTPQRVGYFSFGALSGRDHLTYLFGNVSAKVDKFNATYAKGDVEYNLTNVTGQYYYNDYEQVETYVEKYEANVTCGKLYIGIDMNYSIKNGADGTTSKGWAMCKVLVDPFWFTKTLTMDLGVVSWKTKQAPAINVSSPIGIETSQPVLPTSHRQSLQSMLNGYSGTPNLKQSLLTNLNALYIPYLQKFLNSQVLLQSNNLTYTYKNFNTTYLNLMSDFGLRYDSTFKGLEYKFQFEVVNFTSKCNNLPTEYDPKYGGLQEYIGFQWMREGVWYALSKGVFDVKLGSSWDTETFQWYTGDLANAFDSVKRFPANTPVVGDCKWNNSLYNVAIGIRNTTSVTVDMPFTCLISANSSGTLTTLFNAHFSASFIVRIDIQDRNLQFTVLEAGIMSPSYVGSEAVTNYMVATMYHSKVVKSLVGQKVFGSNFPILYRKYAAMELKTEYIVMYDPSEK